MTIQFLKDNYNNTTAVLVPISDWEKITTTHQDIYTLIDTKIEKPKKLKPSDFRGCISSQTADNLNAHIEQSRKEWNNNI